MYALRTLATRRLLGMVTKMGSAEQEMPLDDGKMRGDWADRAQRPRADPPWLETRPAAVGRSRTITVDAGDAGGFRSIVATHRVVSPD